MAFGAPHDGVNRGWLRAPIDLEFATDQRTVGAAAEAIDADEVVEGGEPDTGSDQASSGAYAAGDRGEGGERQGPQEGLALLPGAGRERD